MLKDKVAKSGDPILMHGTRHLCSSIDPRAEGEKWARSIYHPSMKNYVVLGVGCGYHLRALEPMVSQGGRILAIELDCRLKEFLSSQPPFASCVEIAFFPQYSDKEQDQILKLLPQSSLRIVRFDPCYRLFPLPYSQIEKLLLGRDPQALKQLTFQREELSWTHAISKTLPAGEKHRALSIKDLPLSRAGGDAEEKTIWSLLRELVK